MFSIEEPAVSTRMGEEKIKRHMATGAEFVTGPDSSCLMHMAGIAKKGEDADQVYPCCSNFSCRTMSTEHSKRAAKFTQNVEKTTWHDATFWSVRQRDKMAQELPEWEDLREHASEIKMHDYPSCRLSRYVFQESGEPRVKVHWAKDAGI